MFSIALPFFSGLITASVGTALPGLINMTAAKVSIRDGRDRAMMFITGAMIIVFSQTLSAILFARYIDSRPDIIILLREVGFGIFAALTIYFFFLAKTPKAKKEELKMRSKTSRFFLGMLLSAINFFPVPYYVFITITLASFRLFTFDRLPISSFLVGVVIGSTAIFYYYVRFFNRIETKTDFFFKNMNQIIGSITGLVAFITLCNIIRYYY
jgi:threonine/homoserine/homoserine lactone efflux protein